MTGKSILKGARKSFAGGDAHTDPPAGGRTNKSMAGKSILKGKTRASGVRKSMAKDGAESAPDGATQA